MLCMVSDCHLFIRYSSISELALGLCFHCPARCAVVPKNRLTRKIEQCKITLESPMAAVRDCGNPVSRNEKDLFQHSPSVEIDAFNVLCFFNIGVAKSTADEAPQGSDYSLQARSDLRFNTVTLPFYQGEGHCLSGGRAGRFTLKSRHCLYKRCCQALAQLEEIETVVGELGRQQ